MASTPFAICQTLSYTTWQSTDNSGNAFVSTEQTIEITDSSTYGTLIQMPAVPGVDRSSITKVRIGMTVTATPGSVSGNVELGVGFSSSKTLPTSFQPTTVNYTNANGGQGFELNVTPTVDTQKPWYLFVYSATAGVHIQGTLGSVIITYERSGNTVPDSQDVVYRFA